MERLTAQRCSGIKSGYWSTAKKDELVQLLLASKTSFAARIRLIFNKKIYRQKRLDNIVVKGLYLINRML